MEEKKQIEEMAELIVKSKQCRGDCNKCKHIDDIATVCTSKRVAEEILKRYQPKIPEGAVVLTAGENQKYAAYKIIEPQIKGCLDRERELEKRLETIRKETAREILTLIDKEAPNGPLSDEFWNIVYDKYGVEVE